MIETSHLDPTRLIHDLIETASDMIVVIDRDLRLAAFNAGVAEEIERKRRLELQPGMPAVDALAPLQGRSRDVVSAITRAVAGEPVDDRRATSSDGRTSYLISYRQLRDVD